MRRALCLTVGAAGYVFAVLPMAGFAAFVAGVELPKGVDSGRPGPPATALAIDLALLASFAVVHSALARPAIKRLVASVVSNALERSAYSIVAGLQILLLVVLWRPLPEMVWSVGPPAVRVALWALFAAGWGLVLWSLAAIGSGHLFGFRQALAAARQEAYEPPDLAAGGPYAHLRHPLYAGTALALFAAADMSQGRLLLAGALTAYMLLGVRLEERALARERGADFADYRRRVPALLPRRRTDA